MTRQMKLEVWVGLFVLMTLVSLVFIALKVSNLSSIQERPSYQIYALFSNVGGLTPRAPVKISGVVVGRVSSISIDTQTYRAKVTMDIYQDYGDLPTDSSAAILTAGLLGSQYIGLEVGGDEAVLAAGSRINYTQSALVLENLIGQLMVKLTEGGKE